MAKINVNCYIVILLLLSHQACTQLQTRQMPSPDISALKDDAEPLKDSDEYMPAVMMALHYYTEMMQYEIIQNTATTTRRPSTYTKSTTTTQRTTPRTTSTTRRTTTFTTRPTTTTRRSTTRQTTSRTTYRPVTTKPTIMQTYRPTTPKTTTSKPVIIYQTFKPHQPGIQAPERPPYYIYFNIPIKPEQSYYHKPGIQQQVNGITSISQPDWKNPEFFSWFFQKKPKEDDEFDENELQYLDVLPKKLLIDIHRDFKRRPALLDYDNVVEFRKVYDDSYNYRYKVSEPSDEVMKMNMRIQMQQQRAMLTGKKKAPPTRPYVLMLMLYDLLKREAKTKKLHQYGGFSKEILIKLDESSRSTGVHQMQFLFDSMLANNEITTTDIIARINVIIKDLKNEKSDAYKVLTLIPPLAFLP